ncbi:TPA: hypothetical protein L4559_005098 [Pseudomonas aeruginosa]|nr:hypothetical protein [Pseudomonas aeruginosa]
MTDIRLRTQKDLVELAALAIGLEGSFVDDDDFHDPRFGIDIDTVFHRATWNPRDCDGDSFRILVALGLDVRFDDERHCWIATDQNTISVEEGAEEGDDDFRPAARRAIWYAAAAIGLQMREGQA